jgi:hypothetical protein
MKKIIVLVLLSFLFFNNSESCIENESKADVEQRKATAKAMAEAHRQTGMPAIKNFQEKKLVKMLYEIRDQEKLVCYAYVVNLQGQLIYIGKCIGYGIPYSVQFSNPLRKGSYHDSTAMPQPEPNGLFMPEGLSATWLMMIDNNTGKARPVYIEPQIIVSPFRLH